MNELHTGDGDVATGSIGTQAQEKVQQTAHQASQKTAEYLRGQTEARAGQVGGELRAVADVLRRSGQSLQADGKHVSGEAVDSITKTIERIASYLGDATGDRMLHDVESFGRRRPWGLVGIGVGVGIAASRFLKASSVARYQSSQPAGGTPSRPAVPVASDPPVTQVGYAAVSAE
jgi:ElaB/YqjD/DUF883 family membrane-anchored ribosome-binding protein